MGTGEEEKERFLLIAFLSAHTAWGYGCFLAPRALSQPTELFALGWWPPNQIQANDGDAYRGNYFALLFSPLNQQPFVAAAASKGCSFLPAD